MIGFYVEVYPKGKAAERRSGGRAEVDPKEFFAALDGNGDGKLTKDELPDQLQKRFSLVDTDGDGFVTDEELTTIIRSIFLSQVTRQPLQLGRVRIGSRCLIMT